MENEQKVADIVANEILTCGGLGRVLRRARSEFSEDTSSGALVSTGVDEILTSILRLPDSAEREEISCCDFGELLSTRWLELLAEADFQDLAAVIVRLTERACRLGFGSGPFMSRLLSKFSHDASSIDNWHVVLQQLSFKAQFDLFSASLSVMNDKLRDLAGCAGGNDTFPLDHSLTRFVPLSYLDGMSLLLRKTFEPLFHVGTFVEYVGMKSVSTSLLSSLVLPVRFIVVQSMNQSADTFQQFFRCIFGVWKDFGFAMFNSSLESHGMVSDLLLISLRFISDKFDKERIGEFTALFGSFLSINFSKAATYYLDITDPALRIVGLLTLQHLANTLFPLKELTGVDFEIPDCAQKAWMQFLVDKSAVLVSAKETAAILPSYEADHPKHTREEKLVDSDDESVTSLEAFAEPLKPMESEFPAPRYLRECLLYLKQGKDDTKYGEKASVCLTNLETLVRSKFIDSPMDTGKAAELKEYGVKLSKKVFFLEEDMTIAGFERLRCKSLLALCVASPKEIGAFLIAELWNSKQLNWRGRLEVLNLLVAVSEEVLRDTPIATARPTVESCLLRTIDHPSGLTEATKDTPASAITAGKTRYIHPRTLELARLKLASPAAVDRPSIYRDILKTWFLPLCRGLCTGSLEWLKKEVNVGLFQPIGASSPIRLATPPAISTTTLLFLCRWIKTIMLLLYKAGPFDPCIEAYFRETGHVIGWFWQCVNTSTLESATCDNSESQSMPSLLHHPEVTSTLLFAYWVLFEVSRSMPATDVDVFPFGWLECMASCGTPVSIEWMFHWLMHDVAQHGTNVRDRRLAGSILHLIKARLDKLKQGFEAIGQ